MTVNQENLNSNRDGQGSGIVLVAFLDISEKRYEAAGEPGDLVVSASREASNVLLGIVQTLMESDDLQRLEDQPAWAILDLIHAGRDRQMLMRPLMASLAEETHRGRGGPADPMFGYLQKVLALEKDQEERAAQRRAEWESERAEKARGELSAEAD